MIDRRLTETLFNSTALSDTDLDLGGNGCIAAATGNVGQLAWRGSDGTQKTIALHHSCQLGFQYLRFVHNLHHRLAYWPAVPPPALLRWQPLCLRTLHRQRFV